MPACRDISSFDVDADNASGRVKVPAGTWKVHPLSLHQPIVLNARIRAEVSALAWNEHTTFIQSAISTKHHEE